MNKKSNGHSQTVAKATLLLLATALPAHYVQAAAAPEVAVVQQQATVTGTVVDENGEPLIGVSVVIKGSNANGTITDMDGKFHLQLPSAKTTLLFSYIGYTTQEVAVDGKQQLDVKMKPESNALKEVVVTAMGIRRKEESLTYATQQVRSSDLNRVQDPNLANSLEGKVSGITITPSAGGAGGASKIILRGNKSILGSSQPLIVVDGVPMTNSQHGQVGSNSMLAVSQSEGADALSMINPEDIESVNVLKGANAAALYGSVAANGVLMITTKKGQKGRMRINVSSNVTFDSPLTKPEIQNVYGSAVNEVDGVGTVGLYSWGEKLSSRSGDQLLVNVPLDRDVFSYTGADGKTVRQYNQVHLRNSAGDDLDDFYRTGVTTNNTISLSGGTDLMSSYFSFGNSHANGMLDNNSYNRNSLSFRQMFRFFERATINVSMNYISTKTKNRPGGGINMNPIYHMYTMPRNIDIDYYRNNYVTQNGRWNSGLQYYYDKQTNGSYRWRQTRVALTGPMQEWAFLMPGQNNPYWLLNQNNGTQWEDRFFGNITGNIDIYDGLSFQARLGIDFGKYETDSRRYATTWVPDAMEAYGRYWWNYSKTTEFYTDYMLNYNKTFGDWEVSASAGFVGHTIQGKTKAVDTGSATYVDPNRQYLSDLINWFSVTAGGAGNTTQSRTSDWNKGAVFTAQVGWKDMVYVDGSYRRDWYRAFRQFKSKGTPEDYGYFGFGANAIVSSLVKLPEWWNYLKYRVSYSEVGNSIPNQVYGSITVNWRNKTYTTNQWADFSDPRPEKSHSFETGFEALFLNNRLSFDLTYYNATTSNLYLVGSNASGKSIPMNSAKIRNQGLEGTVGYNFQIARDLAWRTSYNFSYNSNKILRTAYDPETGEENIIATNVGGVRVLYKEGGSVGDMYTTDLRRYAEDGVDANGNPVKAGWYVLNSQGGVQMESESDKTMKKFLGNMNAKWAMGWSNQFTYKDFTLSFLINGRIGGKVLSMTESYLDGYGLSQRSADARLYAEQHNIVATHYPGSKPGMVLDDGSGRIVPVEAYYQSAGGVSPQDIARYLYSGTNFRLRELTLGYTFRDLLGPNRNLSLSFIGRNLFFFYKDAPVDPDVSLSTANGLGAFEVFDMPSSRSFGFSMNINF